MAEKDRSFFDAYPHEYDHLTNVTQREKAHRKEVKAIINKFSPQAVLDAGCATGLTSRLFAERGVTTVGLDRSKVMLDIAKVNGRPYKDVLSFRFGHFERLPKPLWNSFDLVVCLANAIAGVNTLPGLADALRGFGRVLRPGGKLLLQTLNFAAVAEGQIMPVKVTRKGSIVYQRFTERRDDRLYLYVNRLDLRQKPPAMEVFRHEMDNFASDQIVTTLHRVGFTNVRLYRDLFLDKKFVKSSRDLVIVARRPI